ncbi:MAG TPA: hypothetical protein PLW02_03710 [Verrucomicrobiota bacterium]|nr:hypothetical protein [Verrucomicrobiota bacterium]
MNMWSKLLDNSAFLLCFILFCFTGHAEDLTFYVTDFGINQYKDNLRTGDNFENSKACVFPDLPKDSQILIVMPPVEEMDKMSDQQIQQKIIDVLTQRVDAGISKNVRTYEIQIIEYIGTLTYFYPKYQNAVNRFAKCAYEAIGNLNGNLRQEGHNGITFHGIFGSNGTKAFSENVSAWCSYMKDAVFFDGRAHKTAVIETIRTLGAENVRIFNTAGDWLAPNFPWIHSIGNHDVSKQLKEMFSALTVGWIDPLYKLDYIGNGHNVAMKSDSTKHFLVKFWKGDSYTEPTKMSSSQILSQLPVEVSVKNGVNISGGESGVSMQMEVKNLSLQKDETGKIDAIKNEIINNRPNESSLLWRANKKEEKK